MNEITLRLDGMNCTACAEKIESVLVEVDGVQSARVRYEDATGVVFYDPDKTAPDALVAVVNSQTRFRAQRA